MREVSQNTPVVVEGKRDYQLLRRLGIKNLHQLSGKNYFDLLEEIGEETPEVVLLVDLDRQGEKIFQKLKRIFEQSGLKVVDSFREELKEFGVEEVEHLGLLIFGEVPKRKK